MINKRFTLHETKQYDMLEFLDSNRDINDKTVKKLVKSIKEKGLQVPIVVNENKQIVDGQHRFIALRQLGYAVPYIVSHVWHNEDDTVVMQEAKKWSALDFAQSLASRGNVDCIKALEVADDFDDISNGAMGTIRSLELLLDGSGWGILAALKKESYIVNIDVATNVMEAAELMSNYPMGTSPYGQKIIRPLKKLHYLNDGLDLEVIEELVKNNYIKGFSKETDQLEYFIDLYNSYKK